MTDQLSCYVTDSVTKVVRQDPLNILGIITNPLVQLTVCASVVSATEGT